MKLYYLNSDKEMVMYEPTYNELYYSLSIFDIIDGRENFTEEELEEVATRNYPHVYQCFRNKALYSGLGVIVTE